MVVELMAHLLQFICWAAWVYCMLFGGAGANENEEE